MQTENGVKESALLELTMDGNINSIKTNQLKKSSVMNPKREPRDDMFISDGEIKKSDENEDVNGVEEAVDPLNGVLELDETSSDEEVEDSNKADKKSNDSSLKKEELTDLKVLNEPEEMLLNEDEDLMYTNGNSEQFNFNLDSNEQVQGEFLENEIAENPLAECDGESEAEAEAAGMKEQNNDQSNEEDENEDNLETEEQVEADAHNENICDTPTEKSVSNDSENAVTNESPETFEATKGATTTNEETEKIPEPVEEEKESDSKRPSSRESTTSTTSNSSERVLTIRSASELNKLVSDTIVKKEKTQDSTSEESVPDKPHSGGLSILNPSQLGASASGGENLLQNVNFAQSGNQMNVMGYMTSIPSNVVPLQCDVCETQFPDNNMLEEHKANAGHYKCVFGPECTGLVFQSVTEVSMHQQTVHGIIPQSPVQQLAHQVQSLPVRYQMDQTVASGYSPLSQYPTASQQTPRSMVPQVYSSSPTGVQIRQFNALQSSPRLQIGSVRGGIPMPHPANALKRNATSLPATRMTAPKRGRVDYSNRNGDTDCKVVSIQKPDNTDDVVAQLSKSITITARQDSQKKNDTAAVTNMLANRGITVSSVPSKQNRNSNAVTMLNLNSAVSLIPTNTANNKQTSGFAVPQGRANTRQAANVSPSPGRMQTVDLTGPDPPRTRQSSRNSRFQCQICDRTFFNQEQLNQHMITHRNPTTRKQLPYKCNQCTAQYPTQQGLQQHKQTFHRETVSSTNEMVIPIVDLKQPGSLQRLQAIGINHMIPLNALGSQSANGTFGIPVLPFSSDKNVTNNMANCGISNILPIGPLKSLGR